MRVEEQLIVMAARGGPFLSSQPRRKPSRISEEGEEEYDEETEANLQKAIREWNAIHEEKEDDHSVYQPVATEKDEGKEEEPANSIIPRFLPRSISEIEGSPEDEDHSPVRSSNNTHSGGPPTLQSRLNSPEIKAKSKASSSAGSSSQKKKFRKTMNPIKWLAHNHRNIGLEHILISIMLIAYTMFGAAVFYVIESNYEVETVFQRKAEIDASVKMIAMDMTDNINDPDIFVNQSEMKDYFKEAYIKLMSHDASYVGSTLYKAADPENNFRWTFGSAFFFAMNVYTTTGYGSIAPESLWGKAFVIFYGTIFIPITLVILRDLGQWALVIITKIYAKTVFKLREQNGYGKKEKSDEVISLPFMFCMLLMGGYLLFASLFVYELDALTGPAGSGLDFFHSFYFSYISMSTIGLGDITPNNVPYSPLITILFFFGMPVLKVVNRVTYVCLENGVFGALAILERKLDSIVATDDPNQEPSRHMSLSSRSVGPGAIPMGEMGPDHEGNADAENAHNEMLNSFTVRSIATFMKANTDIYGGEFGRVNIRKSDLMSGNNQDTVRSLSNAARK